MEIKMNTNELMEEMNKKSFEELFNIKEHIERLIRYQLIGMGKLDG